MASRTFESHEPDLDPSSYIAEGAVAIGRVTMREFSSLWHNAVARGDINAIEIGRYSNVQDCCVLHVTDDHAVLIGDYVTVGHGAVVHGAVIEDHCLIGMNATVLHGARIGRGSIVAAGAVVLEGTQVPPHSLAAGVPAKVVRQVPEAMGRIHAQAVKYKTLWTKRYGIMPGAGGESYGGEEIT